MTPKHLIRATLGVVGVVAVAELVSRTKLIDPATLPPASTILRKAAKLAVDSEFLTDVRSSLTAWAEGLVLALVAGVLIGLLIGSVRWLDSASRALIGFLSPIPFVALLPLAIVVFSSSDDMKTSMVFYATLWPILTNTVYALREVDPLAKDTLRSYGFGEMAVLLRVSLPSIAPFVATGLRIAASVGLIVVISTELLAGGGDGIGVYLAETQSGGGQTDLMLAGAVFAGVLGLIINVLLVAGERLAFRWHTARSAT